MRLDEVTRRCEAGCLLLPLHLSTAELLESDYCRFQRAAGLGVSIYQFNLIHLLSHAFCIFIAESSRGNTNSTPCHLRAVIKIQ